MFELTIELTYWEQNSRLINWLHYFRLYVYKTRKTLKGSEGIGLTRKSEKRETKGKRGKTERKKGDRGDR